MTILVNNAGVVTGKALMECSDELIQRTFDVNIMAHFWVIKMGNRSREKNQIRKLFF